MKRKNFVRSLLVALGITLPLVAMSCAPPYYRPTLQETRSGRATSVASELALRPGDVRAEVEQVDTASGRIRLRLDTGRVEVFNYDAATEVMYQGRVHDVRDVEAGDVVVVRYPRGRDYLSSITIQETVQERIARGTLPRAPSRNDLIEGIVDNINRDRGVMDVRLDSGRVVTVTLPYDARTIDVDMFRRLRRGDVVRLEGGFVAPSTFQLYAFRNP